MLARTPFTPVRVKTDLVKRLSKDRKRAIRENVVAIMRKAEPTPFAVEGPCRHGIRSSLCLQGWKWVDADAAAHEIVTAALAIVGARRPTWMQGQPEYVQYGVHQIRYDRCLRCRKPMPDGHFKFCSNVCNAAWHAERARQWKAEEINAQKQARRAAWSAKQPEQPCEGCGATFRPRRPGQRFCRQQCVGIVYGGRK